jgi:hypothetical protein
MACGTCWRVACMKCSLRGRGQRVMFGDVAVAHTKAGAALRSYRGACKVVVSAAKSVVVAEPEAPADAMCHAGVQQQGAAGLDDIKDKGVSAAALSPLEMDAAAMQAAQSPDVLQIAAARNIKPEAVVQAMELAQEHARQAQVQWQGDEEMNGTQAPHAQMQTHLELYLQLMQQRDAADADVALMKEEVRMSGNTVLNIYNVCIYIYIISTVSFISMSQRRADRAYSSQVVGASLPVRPSYTQQFNNANEYNESEEDEDCDDTHELT